MYLCEKEGNSFFHTCTPPSCVFGLVVNVTAAALFHLSFVNYSSHRGKFGGREALWTWGTLTFLACDFEAPPSCCCVVTCRKALLSYSPAHACVCAHPCLCCVCKHGALTLPDWLAANLTCLPLCRAFSAPYPVFGLFSLVIIIISSSGLAAPKLYCLASDHCCWMVRSGVLFYYYLYALLCWCHGWAGRLCSDCGVLLLPVADGGSVGLPL